MCSLAGWWAAFASIFLGLSRSRLNRWLMVQLSLFQRPYNVTTFS